MKTLLTFNIQGCTARGSGLRVRYPEFPRLYNELIKHSASNNVLRISRGAPIGKKCAQPRQQISTAAILIRQLRALIGWVFRTQAFFRATFSLVTCWYIVCRVGMGYLGIGRSETPLVEIFIRTSYFSSTPGGRWAFRTSSSVVDYDSNPSSCSTAESQKM